MCVCVLEPFQYMIAPNILRTRGCVCACVCVCLRVYACVSAYHSMHTYIWIYMLYCVRCTRTTLTTSSSRSTINSKPHHKPSRAQTYHRNSNWHSITQCTMYNVYACACAYPKKKKALFFLNFFFIRHTITWLLYIIRLVHAFLSFCVDARMSRCHNHDDFILVESVAQAKMNNQKRNTTTKTGRNTRRAFAYTLTHSNEHELLH